MHELVSYGKEAKTVKRKIIQLTAVSAAMVGLAASVLIAQPSGKASPSEYQNPYGPQLELYGRRKKA